MDEKFNRMPVSVIHLDKDGTVIDVEDYNLDKIEPNLWALKGPGCRTAPLSFASSIRTKKIFEYLMRG